MIHKTVFSLLTGDALRVVGTKYGDVELGPMEVAEPGSMLHTHWHDGTDAVPFNAEQIAARSARPRASARWSNAAMQWVDERTIDERRLDRWAEIKLQRDNAEYGGLAWDGSIFDSDPESQRRIQGAVQLATLAMSAAQPFSIEWTLADNTVRTLNAQEMVEVGLALGAHVQAQHAAARSARDVLARASSAAEIESVLFSRGAP